MDTISRGTDYVQIFTEENRIASGISLNTVDQYILDTSKSNLCSNFGVLKGRAELCELLDTQIPKKGTVQAAYRNYQVFQEMIGTLQIKTKGIKEIVQDSSFVDWEYTFVTVYMPALFSFQNSIHSKFDDFLVSQKSIDLNMYNFVMAFSVVSIGMGMVSFFHMRRCAVSLAHFYEMFTVYTLFENIEIKVTFMRIFRVNVNQLS